MAPRQVELSKEPETLNLPKKVPMRDVDDANGLALATHQSDRQKPKPGLIRASFLTTQHGLSTCSISNDSKKHPSIHSPIIVKKCGTPQPAFLTCMPHFIDKNVDFGFPFLSMLPVPQCSGTKYYRVARFWLHATHCISVHNKEKAKPLPSGGETRWTHTQVTAFRKMHLNG